MHRFFVDSSSLKGQKFQSTDKELCHQVSKVLKMRAGKQIILCDNTEHEYLCEWTTVSKSLCEANILEKKSVDDISSLQMPVHLFVSPLKNQNRWELILEKGTEIGITSFTPLICARSESEGLRKPERLDRIIKEAAEQSGRTRLPELNSPISFTQLIDICPPQPEKSNMIGLIPTLHEDAVTLNKALDEEVKKRTMTKLGVNILIGPEGGFTEEEVQATINAGIRPVSLGHQTLRTETAAIVGATLALHAESPVQE